MKTFRSDLLIPALLLMNFNTVSTELTNNAERKFAVGYLTNTKNSRCKHG